MNRDKRGVVKKINLVIIVFCSMFFIFSCNFLPKKTNNPPVETTKSIVAPTSTLPLLTLSKEISPTSTEEIIIKSDKASSKLENIENVDIEFSIEKNDSPPPISVLQHLKFTAGFGGGGTVCDSQEFWSERTLYWSYGAFTEDNIFNQNDQLLIEWTEPISFEWCGLLPDEKIYYQLKLGDEIKIEKTELMSGPSYISDKYSRSFVHLEFPVGSDFGEYEIIFFNNDWKTERKVLLIKPDSPRFYKIEDKIDHFKYLLMNFQPNEELFLLVYKEKPNQNYEYVKELFDWKKFNVDDSGQLIIDIYNDSYDYWSPIIIGTESGEVSLFSRGLVGSDNHKVSLPDTGLVFFLPTKTELDNMRMVLSSAGFKDVKNPGTNNYEMIVSPDEKINWLFRWCAKDYETMRENLEQMTIEFLINENKLDDGYIKDLFSSYQMSGLTCQPHNVYLRGWEKGKEYTLELRYTIDRDISDGTNIYKSGTYRHIFFVKVKTN